MKIVLDMNLSPAWIPFLKAGGHEVKHWSEMRTEDIRPKTVGKQVLAALQQAEENINQGALVTIDPSKNRIRLLPLKQNNR